MESEKKFIENSEGEEIAAVIHRPSESPKGSILLQHGFFSDKGGSYEWRANYLAKEGFRAVRFDRRGYGESDLDFHEFNLTTGIEDSVTIMDYLEREMNEERFGLFGSSFGGLIAIHLAPRDERVKALTLRSPVTYAENLFAEYRGVVAREGRVDLEGEPGEFDYIDESFFEDLRGYDAEEVLESLETPTLLFHGTMDEVVPIEDTRRFCEKLRVEKELHEYEGEGHVFSVGKDQAVLKKSAQWFSKFLPD